MSWESCPESSKPSTVRNPHQPRLGTNVVLWQSEKDQVLAYWVLSLWKCLEIVLVSCRIWFCCYWDGLPMASVSRQKYPFFVITNNASNSADILSKYPVVLAPTRLQVILTSHKKITGIDATIIAANWIPGFWQERSWTVVFHLSTVSGRCRGSWLGLPWLCLEIALTSCQKRCVLLPLTGLQIIPMCSKICPVLLPHTRLEKYLFFR